jgi:hypothetical protein
MKTCWWVDTDAVRQRPVRLLDPRRYRHEKYLLIVTRIEPQFLGPPAHSLVTIGLPTAHVTLGSSHQRGWDG